MSPSELEMGALVRPERDIDLGAVVFEGVLRRVQSAVQPVVMVR
jgi:hypothetical protein